MWPVVVALACLLSAWISPPIPLWFAIGVTFCALVRVGPISIAVGAILLIGALGSQAQEGLRSVSPGPFTGVVQFTTDPTTTGVSTTAIVRTVEGRFRLVATGAASGALRSMCAGDRVAVVGRIDEPRRSDPARHLRGDLMVESVGARSARTPVVGMIETVRSTIQRGADGLSPRRRPLYLGFVIGDDRGASPVVDAQFEASGLGHLTVVSGENLAFVLVLASPALTRLGPRRRLLLLAVVIGLFAAVTRFEPSILRATAMAAVVAVSVRVGRPASPLRSLSLAVILILLMDPLIVRSLGFRLSLAATTGIIVLAGPISRRVPGPRWLALAIAVPIAAQLGVAPIAIPAFGPQPLLAVPANVLAQPAAAMVMMWGCTAGVIAGVLGDGVASVLHLPTGIALDWVMLVARTVAGLPQRDVGPPGLAAAVGLGFAGQLLRRRTRILLVVTCLFVLVLVLCLGGGPGPPELEGARVGAPPEGAGRIEVASFSVSSVGGSSGVTVHLDHRRGAAPVTGDR